MSFNNGQDDRRIAKVDPQHVILMHSPYDQIEHTTSILQLAIAFIKYWRAFLCFLVICVLPFGYLAYKNTRLRSYAEIISIPTVARLSSGQVVKSPLFPAQGLITVFNLQYVSPWQADPKFHLSNSFQMTNIITQATSTKPAVLTPAGTIMLHQVAPLKSHKDVASLFNKSLQGMQMIVQPKVAYWLKGMRDNIQQKKQSIETIRANMLSLRGSLSNATGSLSESHILMLSTLQSDLLNAVNSLNAQNRILSSLDSKVQVVVPMVSLPTSNLRHVIFYLLGGLILAFILTLLWIGVTKVGQVFKEV